MGNLIPSSVFISISSKMKMGNLILIGITSMFLKMEMEILRRWKRKRKTLFSRPKKKPPQESSLRQWSPSRFKGLPLVVVLRRIALRKFLKFPPIIQRILELDPSTSTETWIHKNMISGFNNWKTLKNYLLLIGDRIGSTYMFSSFMKGTGTIRGRPLLRMVVKKKNSWFSQARSKHNGRTR